MAPSSQRLWVASASTLVVLLSVVATAWAQPVVRVRAGTRIELRGRQSERGVTIEGSLTDDLDLPLAGQALLLSIASRTAERAGSAPIARRAISSAEDGGFHLAVSLPRGDYRVRASYEGDARHNASEQSFELDLAKAELRLRFVRPREARMDLDARQHEIVLLASSEAGGEGLEIVVENERGDKLASGRSALDGTLRVVLPSSALGPPAMGKLVAHTSGDALRTGARTELTILRSQHTSLTLRSSHKTTASPPVLEGSLRAGQRPLAREAIGLFDGAEHIATVLTDAQGTFRYAGLHLPESEPARELHAQARFASTAPWLGSSSSRVIVVTLEPVRPPSVLWLLLPLALSGLLLWQLSRRSGRGPVVSELLGAGIRTGLGSGRAADQYEIAGEVLDEKSGRPIASALVQLTRGTLERHAIAVSELGRFGSPRLSKGDWALSISAEGYRDLAGTFTVPHRGQWSAIRVQLASLRSLAVNAYKPVAIRALPSPELWERWTLRETLAGALRNGRATESFVQLTERVEHAAYRRDPPNKTEVKAIESVAASMNAPDDGIDRDS